jgi:apolipoprotein N-acyltransferase
MNKLNDGLGYAIALPLFLLLIPISISFIILYAILRDTKKSIEGTIIGFIGAFVVAYVIPVCDQGGLIWLLIRIDIVAQSSLAPFIMAVFFGMLAAFIGLIVIKLRKL